MDEPEISIAVMCYNEEKSLRTVVLDLSAEAEKLEKPFEILIINDGSSDNSASVIMELMQSIKQIRLIDHGRNLGLGYAYRSGFSEAKGKYLTFYPADGQFPASQLKVFYENALGADLVLGYFLKQKRNLLSASLSFAERILYRIIIGRMPLFQGLFMIKTSIIKNFTLKSQGRGWGVLLELFIRVYREKKYTVVSIPNYIREREFGKSKVNNFRTIYANLREVLQMRKRLK